MNRQIVNNPGIYEYYHVYLPGTVLVSGMSVTTLASFISKLNTDNHEFVNP